MAPSFSLGTSGRRVSIPRVGGGGGACPPARSLTLSLMFHSWHLEQVAKGRGLGDRLGRGPAVGERHGACPSPQAAGGVPSGLFFAWPELGAEEQVAGAVTRVVFRGGGSPGQDPPWGECHRMPWGRGSCTLPGGWRGLPKPSVFPLSPRPTSHPQGLRLKVCQVVAKEGQWASEQRQSVMLHPAACP